MKICILTRIMSTHSKGGMQDHVLMLASKLAELGHKVVVLTTKHPDGREVEFLQGVRIYYLENTVPESYFGGWWKSSVTKFFELDDEEHFDIVHSQSISGYALFRNKNFKSHSVMSFHGTDIDEMVTRIGLLSIWHPLESSKNMLFIIRQFYYYIRFSLPCVGSCEATIVTSNEQDNIINKYYFGGMIRVYKVLNGIESGVFVPMHIDKEDNVILAVARIEREKGIQNIIKAVPIILSYVPTAKLAVIGDGSYMPQLKKLVSKKQLSESVIFVGSIPFESLPYYFNSCTLFVNPTLRQNGYDLTILEAMACEKPVVVSNIGSIPTVIVNEHNGFLFSKGNTKELADIVIKILKDTTLAHNVGIEARKTILNKFSADKMAKDTINVYTEIMNKDR